MNQNIKSLVLQILGKQNVFGYSNMVINRIHLMHWLAGEFYYSNVFNRKVRLLWVLFFMVSGLVMLSHCIFYIVFTSNLKYIQVLYTSEVILSEFYLLMLFPLVSYVCRKDSAEALTALDRADDMEVDKMPIFSPDIEFVKREKYGSKVLLKILITQLSLGTCFILSSNLHLLIGFTADKLKEPDYYLYPTYSEKVDNWMTFFILLLSQFIPSIPIVMMSLLVPLFSLAATREFYYKFQTISDSLDHQSKLLTIYYERLLDNRRPAIREIRIFQRMFISNVYLFAKHHQKLLSGIAHFKKYLQFNMSATVALFLYNEVLLVYMIVLSGSFLTQMKALNMAVGISLMLYVNCLIGELFFEMGEMFNDSVYNMPWYYLPPSKRKSYLLLLHQAQMAIKFKIMRIYSIDMTFFLRMCNYVYSIVNVLRRLYNTKYNV